MVVGVLKPRASSVASGPDRKDLDLDVFLPLNTMRLRIGARRPPDPPGSGPAEECELSGAILVGNGVDQADVRPPAAAVLDRTHPRGDVATTVIRRRNP